MSWSFIPLYHIGTHSPVVSHVDAFVCVLERRMAYVEIPEMRMTRRSRSIVRGKDAYVYR